jgi:hypothetical protein
MGSIPRRIDVPSLLLAHLGSPGKRAFPVLGAKLTLRVLGATTALDPISDIEKHLGQSTTPFGTTIEIRDEWNCATLSEDVQYLSCVRILVTASSAEQWLSC